MVRGGQEVRITGWEQVTHQVDLDESLAAADNLADLEDTGHVADKVWQVGLGTRFSFCFSCDTKSRYAVLLFY